MYVVPSYGRSQIWTYVVDLERFVVVPIEPRKGDAVEFFRDPKRDLGKMVSVKLIGCDR